jgi:predicted RNA-binding Zn-ribbon protein involved in translation (DUF1610 family)
MAKDPTASVLCPECGDADLVVEDVAFGDSRERIERYLSCPACGATNSVLSRGKGKGCEDVQ